MNVGTEWLVDAEGCTADLLRDVDTVRRVCEEVINDLDLRVVGDPLWNKFPAPGGVTGLYLLTESHLGCHTFPEAGIATFNLYCCRERPAFAWDERLRVLLAARRVTVRTAGRGSKAAADKVSFEASSEAAEHGSYDVNDSKPTPAREVTGL